MITLHIKQGEYIYLTSKATREDSYKILLVNCDSPQQGIEVGLLDCRDGKEANMVTTKLNLGERQSIFSKTATINALKYEFHGIDFALSCSPDYHIENDFTRRKKLGSIKKAKIAKQRK